MKELEHVVRRVRIWHAGSGQPPERLRGRVLSLLRTLAESTKHDAPWDGVQISITGLGDRLQVHGRTVQRAVSEAIALHLIRRHQPEAVHRGHATPIYTLHPVLIQSAVDVLKLPWSISHHGALYFPRSWGDSDPVETDDPLDKNHMKNQQVSEPLGVTKRPKKTMKIVKSAPQPGVTNCHPGIQGIHTPPLVGGCLPAPAPPPEVGGCETEQERIELIQDDIFKFGRWLNERNIDRLELKSQRRKKNKERGGIIKLGPFGPRTCTNDENLISHLTFLIENKIEALTCHQKILVVDDPDIDKLKILKETGLSYCLIQTSTNKYQILFSLTSDNWTTKEVKNAQRHLVDRYDGDWGCVGYMHPHRLPGSINQKYSVDFVTRLIEVGEGHDLAPFKSKSKEPKRDLRGAINNEKTGRIVNSNRNDASPSAADMSNALRMAWRGASRHQIELMLIASCVDRNRGGRTDHTDYVRRTVDKAIPMVSEIKAARPFRAASQGSSYHGNRYH